MGQGSPSLPLSSRTLSSCILQTSPSVVPQESLSSPWAQLTNLATRVFITALLMLTIKRERYFSTHYTSDTKCMQDFPTSTNQFSNSLDTNWESYNLIQF